MIQIPQGKPEPKHFYIAYPPQKPVSVGEKVVCRHPRTGNKTHGKIVAMLTEPWINIPDSFCLLTYGRDSAELRKSLEKAFPDFREQNNIRFLLINEQ